MNGVLQACNVLDIQVLVSAVAACCRLLNSLPLRFVSCTIRLDCMLRPETAVPRYTREQLSGVEGGGFLDGNTSDHKIMPVPCHFRKLGKL